MNIERIRSKYQQILEENESDNSEEDVSQIHKRVNNRGGKRVLTQCSNNYIINPQNAENNILKLKEKLAQSLTNLKLKEQQIKGINMKFENVRYQNINLQQEIIRLNEKIRKLESCINQKDDVIKALQIKVANKDIRIQSQVVDKQLLQQQINFYHKEVENYKNQIKNHKKQFTMIAKDIENVDHLKNQNERLRSDISRLGQLLQESQRYKNIPRLVHNCSYLGKPLKEVDNWFPQDLIGQAQHFLKKQQIGYGNKPFLHSLVKFIDRQIKRNVKDVHVKIRRLQTQRKRSHQRKYNQLFCMHEITNLNSSKSRLASSLCHNKQTNFSSTTNQPKRSTQSFIYDKLQRSLAAHEFTKGKKVYIELFEEFKKAMTQILNEKNVKRKKISKLVAWICQSSIDLLNSLTSYASLQHQHTQKLKLLQ